MKRDEVLAMFRELARSQGRWGRLLRDIAAMDQVQQDEFFAACEGKDMLGVIDMVEEAMGLI